MGKGIGTFENSRVRTLYIFSRTIRRAKRKPLWNLWNFNKSLCHANS